MELEAQAFHHKLSGEKKVLLERVFGVFPFPEDQVVEEAADRWQVRYGECLNISASTGACRPILVKRKRCDTGWTDRLMFLRMRCMLVRYSSS
jgi:hypothetical protein